VSPRARRKKKGMEDQKPGGFCVATGVYSNSRSVGIFRNSGPPGSLEFGRPRALYSFFGSRKTKSQTPEINVLVKKPPSSRRQNTYSVPSLAGRFVVPNKKAVDTQNTRPFGTETTNWKVPPHRAYAHGHLGKAESNHPVLRLHMYI
jgi:hypothetical protein